MTGRKDPRLGAGTVSSAVHDPAPDHRGDRCPATLATRDGQPSQPVVACLSVHAARLPRKTRSSPWLTALALGGARVVGAAELAAEAAAPRPASSNGSRRVWPDVSAMPRGGPTRAGPRGTSCTGSPRHRPIGPAYPALWATSARSARRAFWGVVRFALAEYGWPVVQTATGAGESEHSIASAGAPWEIGPKVQDASVSGWSDAVFGHPGWAPDRSSVTWSGAC